MEATWDKFLDHPEFMLEKETEMRCGQWISADDDPTGRTGVAGLA
jgi:hypothetical protein